MTLSLDRSGVYKSRPIKFCTEAPNICGYCVRNLVLVIPVAPRSLRRLLNFREICTPLSNKTVSNCFNYKTIKKDRSEIIKLVISYGNRMGIFFFALQVLTSDLKTVRNKEWISYFLSQIPIPINIKMATNVIQISTVSSFTRNVISGIWNSSFATFP